MAANHVLGELLSAIELSATFYVLVLIERGFREELFRWLAPWMLREPRRTEELIEMSMLYAAARGPPRQAEEEEVTHL